MDAREWLGLEPTHNPRRWYLPVVPGISTGGGNTTVNNGVRWFLYSPCTVSIGGTVTGFKGQIYGGTVTYPNNSGLQFAQVSVPGAAYPNGQQPVTTTSAVVSSRWAG